MATIQIIVLRICYCFVRIATLKPTITGAGHAGLDQLIINKQFTIRGTTKLCKLLIFKDLAESLFLCTPILVTFWSPFQLVVAIQILVESESLTDTFW